jgi:hypothetical protein
MDHVLDGVSSPASFIAYAIGGAGTIVKTSNSGANWQIQNSGTTQHLRAVYFINDYLGYVVGDNGTILKTITGGDVPLTISGQIRFQDNNQPVSSGFVKAVRYDSASRQVITVDSANIQSNGNYSLVHIPIGISTDIMAFENDEAQLVFVPTYYPSTIYYDSATTLYVNGNMNNIDIQVFRINNAGGPYHIAGTVSTNNYIPVVGLKDAIIYAKSGNNFQAYSVSNTSGYYRVDSLNSGTYNIIVDRMGCFPVNRQVVITNYSKDSINIIMDNNGVMLGTLHDGNEIPTKFLLNQNYPNPFNPSTIIKYQLPVDAQVSIKVYDITGRLVETLTDDFKKSGYHETLFDGTNYASGIYLYRIVVGDPSTGALRSALRINTNNEGNFVESKKMVLIK